MAKDKESVKTEAPDKPEAEKPAAPFSLSPGFWIGFSSFFSSPSGFLPSSSLSFARGDAASLSSTAR